MPRKQDEAIYDGIYTETGKIGDPCVYCGQPSDCYDHVPPLHYIARLSQADIHGYKLKKHPACVECNSYLTGLVLLTKKERRLRVKEKLRSKYKSYLKMPFWDEEELEELDPYFADGIRRATKFATFIRQRLAYYS